MKRLALVAAVLAVAACGQKDTNATDTTDVMTPAPATTADTPISMDTTVPTDTMADTSHGM